MGLEHEPVIQKTKQLIEIPSLSGSPDEDRAQVAIAGMFKEADIPVTITPHFVVARLEGNNSKKALMLIGHPDVVPAPDAAQWIHPPFTPTTEGDALYGRGSTDMKGNVAAAIQTMTDIKRSGVAPECDVIFISAKREEDTGEGIIAASKDADLLKVLGQYEQVGAVFTEPSLDCTTVLIGHRGNVPFEAEAHGKSAHISQANELRVSENAPLKLLGFAGDLIALSQEWEKKYKNDTLGAPQVAIGDFVGNEGSVTNQIQAQVGLKGDARTIVNTHSITPFKIDGVANHWNVTVKYHVATPPALSDPNAEFVQVATQTAKADKGLFAATSDWGHMSRTLPPEINNKVTGIILGAGTLDVAHRKDEWVSMTAVVRTVQVYKDLIKNFGTN